MGEHFPLRAFSMLTSTGTVYAEKESRSHLSAAEVVMAALSQPGCQQPSALQFATPTCNLSACPASCAAAYREEDVEVLKAKSPTGCRDWWCLQVRTWVSCMCAGPAAGAFACDHQILDADLICASICMGILVTWNADRACACNAALPAAAGELPVSDVA